MKPYESLFQALNPAAALTPAERESLVIKSLRDEAPKPTAPDRDDLAVKLLELADYMTKYTSRAPLGGMERFEYESPPMTPGQLRQVAEMLETGDRELIEDSWRDDFWGWGPNRERLPRRQSNTRWTHEGY